MNNQAGDNVWRTMTSSEYMKTRVDDQLRWYSKKSATNKRWHLRLQLITLIAAALVPVVSLSSSADFVRIIVAVIGSIAAIAAGVVALFQFRDLWVDYRSAAEQLKYEKFLYLTGASPYTGHDCFPLFVVRVENIIVRENRGWVEKVNAPVSEISDRTDTTDNTANKETDSDGQRESR